MSKSLGNFFTVHDLLEDYDRELAISNIGSAIRLRFLQTHYRSPIDISKKSIEDAANKLDMWARALETQIAVQMPQVQKGNPVIQILMDDLNTPGAIAKMDELANVLLAPYSSGTVIGPKNDRSVEAAWLAEGFELLGFDLDFVRPVRHSVWSERLKSRALQSDESVGEHIEALLKARADARANKDWAHADLLRDALMKAGVILKDAPGGAEWELGPNFDPSKLEALK